ncbi:MAG: hypothetical protein HKO70_12530 [Acidimicrobiia bacterium]|nr:hypothetical protein [Acidimicrobiia bacterium]
MPPPLAALAGEVLPHRSLGLPRGTGDGGRATGDRRLGTGDGGRGTGDCSRKRETPITSRDHP